MKLRKGKLLGFIILTLFLGFIFKLDVNAASASVSVTSNKSSLVVGNTVTFTVRVQADTAIGAWDYATNVSSNLTYISGSPVSKSANLPSNNSTKVITYSFTYRANSSGTATFNFRLSNLLDYKTESLMSFPANTSRNVKVITQNELEQSYSKNNNLKSLSIEGYQLSPTFNKNTLEYNVEVPNDVTKVKINAIKEDSTASIQGTGEREVSEGKNKLEIKVTAQNGSVKTYVINVTVKELDPIKVKVDNEEFNVVRKESQITAPNSTFTNTTIKINDLEVPAFENKELGYILVGLKNEDGDIALYIYDEKENSYTLYQEYNFKSSIICIIDDINKIPEGYDEVKIKIDDKTVTVYQKNKDSKFYLFYGVNVETGKENLYIYDSEEETVQRYNDDEQNTENKSNEEIYQYIIIGLGSLLIITYLVLLITLINNSRKKKRLEMKRMSKKRRRRLENEENNNNNNDNNSDDNNTDNTEIQEHNDEKEES